MDNLSDDESIDASLLDAIENPRIERWPSVSAFLPLEVPASDLIAAAHTDVAARIAPFI